MTRRWAPAKHWRSLNNELAEPKWNRNRIVKMLAAILIAVVLIGFAWHHGVDFAPDYLYDKLSAMH